MSKRQYHIFYLMMQADGIYEKSVEIHEVKRHLPIPSGSVSLYYALCEAPVGLEEEPVPEEAKGMEGFGAAKGTGKA